MKIYADLPVTRLRQLITDLLVVVWVYAWIRLGLWLYDLVSRLAAPGRKLESAGTGMADNLGNAGRKIDRVPGVGDALSTPFGKAADAARSVAEAGHEQQVIVHDLALVMAVAVVAVPLGLVLFGWLPPLRRLAALDPGIAAAWRRGDPAAVEALAALELRRLGLRG